VTHSGLTLDVRYRLEERIAAGGVGQVWRGRDLLLQRPVAIKLLRPEYSGHPQTLERFRAEARHAGRLSHPCIAQVHDYCDGGADASPYLVMELVNGPSLADVLAAGAISAARTLNIIAQAAAGLAAAHQTGLVHRDIKPGNILLSSGGLVKITDFGIAHAAGTAPVTDPAMVMGTAQYLAPERITGSHESPASDLYSLGIVLYECLTGQPPFDGTTAEIMSGHLYRPLPPLPAGVPPAISELLARLTAKDPAARLVGAEEVAAVAGRLSATLEAAPTVPPAAPAGTAESEPVPAAQSAKPTGADARPARGGRRRILVVATATAVLAVFCGLLTSGALRVATRPGQAAPGPAARLPGPYRGAAGEPGQADEPTAAPSPSPRPSRNAGPKRNGRPGQNASAGQGGRPARQAGEDTANTPKPTSTPRPTETPSSGSTGSGSGVQLRLPGTGIGVSLNL